MPKVFEQFIEGNNIFICSKCNSHLSKLSELVSKAFRGQHGTAYLFTSVMNITMGKTERKRLTTGMHTTCDIFCSICANNTPVGWKYIAADDEDQKYKEGKYILQEALIDRENWIDD